MSVLSFSLGLVLIFSISQSLFGDPELQTKTVASLPSCKVKGKVVSEGRCINRRHCRGNYQTSAKECHSPTGRPLVCCSLKDTYYPVKESKSGECGQRLTALTPREMSAEPIVGGITVWPNSWPWMVAVYDGDQYVCGGSLISGRCVLTAAHCFVNSNPDPSHFFARVGEHNLFTDGEAEFPMEHGASRIILHPKFIVNQSDHDMAIMILSEESHKLPVCLPNANLKENSFQGVSAVVTGWGTRVYDPDHREPMSPELQEVTVPILPMTECEKNYRLIPDYKVAFQKGLEPERFMCAGYKEGGKDACLGDSGGPLVAEIKPGFWHQIGVVTIGFACGQSGFPGIYTRVTEYLPWIHEHCQPTTPD